MSDFRRVYINRDENRQVAMVMQIRPRGQVYKRYRYVSSNEDFEGRLQLTIVVQDPEHQLPDLSFKVMNYILVVVPTFTLYIGVR